MTENEPGPLSSGSAPLFGGGTKPADAGPVGKAHPNQGILTKNKRRVVKSILKHGTSETARKFGTTPANVSRFKSREDVQALIRREHEKMAELAPLVVGFYQKVVERGNELIERDGAVEGRERVIDAKLIGEAIKAGQTIGQAVGLFPSHLQIHNHFLASDSPSLSPILQALLAHAVPCIDVTPPPVPVDKPLPLQGEEERGGG